MFKKLISAVLMIILMSTLSSARASTKSNSIVVAVAVPQPVSEKTCLEAFVASRFDYAHKLCLSLAQRGMREAQLVTGLMYAFGEGTEKNLDMARMWLKEAVRNGSAEAKEVLTDLNDGK